MFVRSSRGFVLNRAAVLSAVSDSLQRLIGLRRYIESGLRHPVVGPLLLLLLAVLVVFMALHEMSEGLPGDAAMACVAIALVLMTVIPLTVSRPLTSRPAAKHPPRAPPVQSRPLRRAEIITLDFVPLRL